MGWESLAFISQRNPHGLLPSLRANREDVAALAERGRCEASHFRT
jgi:hypothetical protein